MDGWGWGWRWRWEDTERDGHGCDYSSLDGADGSGEFVPRSNYAYAADFVVVVGGGVGAHGDFRYRYDDADGGDDVDRGDEKCGIDA